MKPIHTLIGITFSTFFIIAVILGIGATIGAHKSIAQYSTEDLKEVSKSMLFTDSINGLMVGQGIKISYTVSNQDSFCATVTAKNAAMKGIKLEKKKNFLIISVDDNMKKILKKDIRVAISGKALEILDISSGAEFAAKGVYNTQNLSITASSGCEIEMDSLIDNKTTNITASSGAKINVCTYKSLEMYIIASSGSEIDIKNKGTQPLKQLNLTASSGSEIDAEECHALLGQVIASSGSEINCYIDNANTAKSSGGNIENKR